MKFIKILKKTLLATSVVFASSSYSAVLGVNVIESGDDAVSEIASVFSSGDVNVISGSEIFSGAQGDMSLSQSATFTSLNLSDGNSQVSMGEGFILTSGSADALTGPVNTVNETTFDLGDSNDADLITLAQNNGLNSNISNVNFFQFDFTLEDEFNAITLDFIFGTEEFPTQSVTDIFGVFVDGVNFAFFPDNSLVNNGGNPGNFNDNSFGSNAFDIELNGFSDVLSLVGQVDTSLDVHTLKIAIGDTLDTRFDSAAFIGNLGAINSNDGGIIIDANAPSILALLGFSLAFMGFRKIKR